MKLMNVLLVLTMWYLCSCSSANQGPEHPTVYRIESIDGKIGAFESQQFGEWLITPIQIDGQYWYGVKSQDLRWHWQGPATGQVVIHCDSASCVEWALIVYENDSMTFRVEDATGLKVATE